MASPITSLIDWVNSQFRSGLVAPIRPPGDPLAIDLDGDGLETVGVGSTPVLFDHNADGIRTGTGWVRGDDAWLVLDRDANGTIDSGRELFGVDTLITNANGTQRMARDGFEALRTLDSNADGMFDASDTAFAQVRLWQDLNQDGISQSIELFTLADRSIASIGLTPSGGTTNLGNGNIVTGRATVTRSNGSTTEVDSVAVSTEASNLDLALNPFYREFTDVIPLTVVARGLPEMGGSGVVRDLREAMSLGNPQADALVAAVQAFAAGDTRAAQRGALDELLRTWAATEAISDRFTMETPGQETRRFTVTGSADAALRAQLNRVMPILEVFNGMTVDDSGWVATTTVENGQTIRTYSMAQAQADSMLAAYESLRESVYGSLVVQTRLRPYLDSIELVIDEAGVSFSTTALAALLADHRSTGEADALRNLIELNQYAQGTLQSVGFDGLGLLATWINELAVDSPSRSELSQLRVFMGAATVGTASNDIYLGDAANNTAVGGAGDDALVGGLGADNLRGEAGDDVLYGGAGADTLQGDDGNDLLDGGGEVDFLQGGGGNDVLDGGAGNDTLTGGSYSGYSGLYTGEGNDTYRFGLGDGQDVLVDIDATAGNLDTIEFKAGVAPSDVRLTRNSDGQLVVSVGAVDGLRVSGFFGAQDVGVGAIELIRFADGTSWDLAAIKQIVHQGGAGNDYLIGYATNDALTGGAGNDTMSGRDGDDMLAGGDGADVIHGDNGNDVVDGNAGNDTLYGGDGQDTLDGGDGADWLEGAAGDDVLSGGAGNDTLTGGHYNGYNGLFSGSGNDTYRFGRGDGVDRVYDYDTTTGNIDRVVFRPDVAVADVQLRRDGDALLMSIVGTADQLRIEGYFGNDGDTPWSVERFEFSDGTVWGLAEVKAIIFTGGDGNETITGYASDDVLRGNGGGDVLAGRDGHDTLYGGSGNDQLSGENGNDVLDGGDGVDFLQGGQGDDVLDGGTGNDTLIGGAYNGYNGEYYGWGNDTYRFGRGSGLDVVVDYDSVAGNLDTIEIGVGIAPHELRVSRNDNNELVLSIAGTTDTLRVSRFFSSQSTDVGVIEQIRFADGTVWDVPTIRTLVQQGSAANDYLVGYAAGDALDGGAGNDRVFGRDGNDTLRGGAGDDLLYGESGDDTLLGDDGNDALSGDDGNDLLDGGAGNDILTGWYGDDVLDGGAGNDTLAGGRYDNWNGQYQGWGSDTYRFGRGSGQDVVVDYDEGTGGIDTIELGLGVAPGDVRLSRNDNNELVVSLDGSTDTLRVSRFFSSQGTDVGAVEQMRFADGTVWNLSTMLALAQQGSVNNDYLVGYAQADVLDGAGGNDRLFGRDGNDTLRGGDGADLLFGEAGDDQLEGGAGNDELLGGDGADVLHGGDGADLVQGGGGDDGLDGGTGNDTLTGGQYNGYSGQYSGAGNDSYFFGRGDGQDSVLDDDSTTGNVDRIIFKTGVASTDVQVSRSGSDLYLTIAATSDRLRLVNYFANDGSTSWSIERIEFTDEPGTSWALADVKLMALNGGAGNDNIQGYASADSLSGGAGDDLLAARDGDDLLDGGVGNDGLAGEAGNDSLLGGDGADFLQGGSGDDILGGGAGNDTLTGGDYNVYNGQYSGLGNDSYLFGRGDGVDRVWDNDSTAGNVDRVVLGSGIAPTDIRVVRDGNAAILKVLGTSDELRLENYFANNGSTPWSIERVEFVDGTVWTLTEMTQQSQLTPGVTITGTAGNDNLTGGSGNDTLIGGEGIDTLNGVAGDDLLQGGDGTDTLYGEEGADTLQGGAGADNLQGGNGNDVLDGGAGNDNLNGSAGNNTYLFGRGDGQDFLRSEHTTASARINTLNVRAGVLPSELVARRVGTELHLTIAGTSDRVAVESFFHLDNPAGNNYTPLQRVVFSDGTVWDLPTLTSMALVGSDGADTIRGTVAADSLSGGLGNDDLNGAAGDDLVAGGEGNDTLYGEEGADTLQGGAGSDNLQGGNGNDMLEGGAGNDQLYGHAGNNSFVFGRGDGQDFIRSEYTTVANRLNTLSIREGVAPSELVVRRVGTELHLSVAGTSDRVAIESFFHLDNPAGNNYTPLQQVVFADGTVWDLATLTSLALAGSDAADTIRGTHVADTLSGGLGDDNLNGAAGDDVVVGGDGNDTLYGEDGVDTLQGGAGTDYLYGGNGNDVIEGGAGNDQLYGHAGNNSFVFGRGDGQDFIRSEYTTVSNRVNTLNIREGVAPGELVVRRVNNTELHLSIAGTSDRIAVESVFHLDNPAGNNYTPLQRVVFSDGTVWDLATLTGMALAGSDGADSIRGLIGADSLNGGLGNDVLNGAAGDDLVAGGEGNDTLYGEEGADTLQGGAGADYLVGGNGNDTYRWGRGDGSDTISNYDPSGSDALSVLAGVATDQLWFRRLGGDLEISIIGTDDKALVSNWYSGGAYQLDQLITAEGDTLLAGQVQNLVDAMAGFAPPAAGQTSLPPDYRAALGSTIAANWQPGG